MLSVLWDTPLDAGFGTGEMSNSAVGLSRSTAVGNYAAGAESIARRIARRGLLHVGRRQAIRPADAAFFDDPVPAG
jgi:hypothetical protein